MRYRRNVLVAAAAVAAAVTATAAPAATAKEKVKAKIHDGTLTVTGTNGDDGIALRLAPGDSSTLEVLVDGGRSERFKRSKFVRIVVEAGGGDDALTIDESNGAFTNDEATTLDGEGGNDSLVGGSSAETSVGGAGNDTVNPGRGNDTALLGAGDDSFVWNPGDGSDTVEGQDGSDTMQFNGANINEKIDLAANGNRLRLSRDVATITMDTNGVETVNIRALGGADTITVDNLNGTDVHNVNTDLAAGSGGGDGQPDNLIANGTAAADRVHVGAAAGPARVFGLAPQVSVEGPPPTEPLPDR